MSPTAARGQVLLYADHDDDRRSHQAMTYADVARMIARLKAFEFAGYHEAGPAYPGPLYFVPLHTLVGREAAHALGIRSANDLYGGVVPYAFVQTKAIAHPLVGPDASRPAGWSDAFAARVRDVTLPGFTVFSRAEARVAAERLLAHGPCRLKRTRVAGGRGQHAIKSLAEFERALRRVPDDELTGYGLVLELDLRDVTTYSVGEVTVDHMTIAYHGQQRLTVDNHGSAVYGGSDLVVVRGPLERLLDLHPAPSLRRVIQHAIAYGAAAEEYPGVIASRRNYDVGSGVDARGQPHTGVFEHSWRIGGASGAEVAALQALAADATIDRVEASTVETYGDQSPRPPAHAIEHWSGVDPEVGPITRYTIVTRTHPRAA
jgi:hypothetical protein